MRNASSSSWSEPTLAWEKVCGNLLLRYRGPVFNGKQNGYRPIKFDHTLFPSAKAQVIFALPSSMVTWTASRLLQPHVYASHEHL